MEAWVRWILGAEEAALQSHDGGGNGKPSRGTSKRRGVSGVSSAGLPGSTPARVGGRTARDSGRLDGGGGGGGSRS
eukprot:354321-Chlamydomonas_euryale.AAC.10